MSFGNSSRPDEVIYLETQLHSKTSVPLATSFEQLKSFPRNYYFCFCFLLLISLLLSLLLHLPPERSCEKSIPIDAAMGQWADNLEEPKDSCCLNGLNLVSLLLYVFRSCRKLSKPQI